MTRTSKTRSALFTSIISLLLCVSMLVGTTFAWFTDEVKSGRNVIAAGNLDVELYHSDSKVTDEKVTSSTMLFDDVNPNLWEPGAVAYENLQVKNVGTLALKYQLSLTVLNETVVSGNKLSDVIKVGIVAGGVKGTTRDAVVKEVSSWTKLSEFQWDSSTKSLAAGAAADKIGVVLYWEPNSNEIDNLYNMNNENKGQTLKLDIGVNLYATQVEAEDDSFGNDYDEDAWSNAMQVTTADDLQDAINNGETAIILEDDIDLTSTVEIPENATVALNLNGKTLTGNIEIAKGANVTVNNGTINNTNSGASAIQNNGGELVLNDVEIASARHGVRVEGGKVTINGGTYKAAGTKGMTQHALNVSDGAEVIVNGGTFIGPKGSGADSGAAVNVQANSTVIINGGNFSGGLNNTLASKGTLTVKGGTFDQDPSAYVAEFHTVTDNGNGTWSVAMSNTNLSDMIKAANSGDTVVVPAGTYTFPASALKEGVTLQCSEGTVFEGQSSLDINGATVKGATFSNEDAIAVRGTINGTLIDCTFEGSEALRWCYAGETVKFVNCVFNTDFRGVHFDGMDHDVYFEGCVINGFNAFGGDATVTFVDCTFGCDDSSYNGLNLYCNTELKDCTFKFNTGKTNFIDMEGTGKTLSISNCTATLDGAAANVTDFVGGSKLAENTVIVDGAVQKSASTQDALNSAVTSGGAVNVELAEGNYSMPGVSNSDVTISGSKDAVITIDKPAFHGSDVTFNGVTVKGSGYSTGVQHVDTVTYNDVTIEGEMCLYGEKVVFNGCTFKLSAGQYIWTYGANEVEFINCTFNTAGKAILIYNEGDGASKVTVKGCTFNATAGAKAGAINNQNCAAIEIDNFQDGSKPGTGHSLITEGNTYSSNFSGEWRIKNYQTGDAITVNGVQYKQIAIDGKLMTIDEYKNVTVH